MLETGIRDWDFPRSISSVALIARFGAERGIARETLLAGSGLHSLDDPDQQIEAGAELEVLRNLHRHATGISGLDLGMRYHVTTFGVFGFACISSPTLLDAITLALRYLELSFTFCIPEVEIADGRFHARIRDDIVPEDIRSFVVERDLAAMATVLSDLLGTLVPVRSVHLRYPEPMWSARYDEAFGVRPFFDADGTDIELDPAVLEHPLPQANRETLELCVAQCRALVNRRRQRTGIAHDVREQLVGLGGVPAGIDQVATALNISARTLRRRLEEEGTSYRALLDEVREALATEMLTHTPLSVSDVAVRLGYSEASTFIHAFKRWKGMTPAAFARARRVRTALSGGKVL